MPVDTGLAYFISAKKKKRQQSAGRRQQRSEEGGGNLKIGGAEEEQTRPGNDEGVGTLEATRDTCVPDSNLNCSVSSITYKQEVRHEGRREGFQPPQSERSSSAGWPTPTARGSNAPGSGTAGR